MPPGYPPGGYPGYAAYGGYASLGRQQKVLYGEAESFKCRMRSLSECTWLFDSSLETSLHFEVCTIIFAR